MLILERYQCAYLADIKGTDLYFWNKTVSDHCCLHCDGTVYRANTEIETTVLDNDCNTIQTLGDYILSLYYIFIKILLLTNIFSHFLECKKDANGKANIVIDFNYKYCCNDNEGMTFFI